MQYIIQTYGIRGCLHWSRPITLPYNTIQGQSPSAKETFHSYDQYNIVGSVSLCGPVPSGVGDRYFRAWGGGGALLNLKTRVASPTGTTEELLGK